MVTDLREFEDGDLVVDTRSKKVLMKAWPETITRIYYYDVDDDGIHSFESVGDKPIVNNSNRGPVDYKKIDLDWAKEHLSQPSYEYLVGKIRELKFDKKHKIA